MDRISKYVPRIVKWRTVAKLSKSVEKGLFVYVHDIFLPTTLVWQPESCPQSVTVDLLPTSPARLR